VRSGLDDKIADWTSLHISRRRRYLCGHLSTRCRHKGGKKVAIGYCMVSYSISYGMVSVESFVKHHLRKYCDH